jgi:hypothetical protein
MFLEDHDLKVTLLNVSLPLYKVGRCGGVNFSLGLPLALSPAVLFAVDQPKVV